VVKSDHALAAYVSFPIMTALNIMQIVFFGMNELCILDFDTVVNKL